MRLVQPSQDTVRSHVSSTNPRYGRVAERHVVTWAEFKQSMVECNITFSQMTFLDFPKVKRYNIQVRLANVQAIDVKFSQDLTLEKSLKLLIFD